MKTTLPLTLIIALAWTTAAQAQFLTDPHDGTNNINCLNCHTIHGTPLYDYKTIDGNINLCKSCHNDLGVGDINTHSPNGVDMMCSRCHNPHRRDQEIVHGATFSKLIRENITTLEAVPVVRPVKLLDVTGPNNFADGDVVYDGVCEVCHDPTDPTPLKYHLNDGSGQAHNAQADCRTCHFHIDGFAPAGGSCVACHYETKGSGTFAAGTMRRAIVDDPNTGGTIEGDFQNSIGGHHSGTDPTDFVCAVCHREGVINDSGTPGDPSDDVVDVDSNFHNSGTAPYSVDLRNVDDANASYPVWTDPTNWPAGAGPNGPVGSPINQNKRNMTEFCIGCHDTDGASVIYSADPAAPGSATDPFGDGNSQLDVYQKFLASNFSSHALASSKAGLGPKYTADYPTDTSAIKSAAFVNSWGSADVTECSDCHLGQDPAGTPSYYHNAHGGRNLQWLGIDKNGIDQPVLHDGSTTDPDDESVDSTVVCFRCHNPVTYSNSESGSGSSSRYDEHGRGGHSDSGANVFDIGCLNCHGGDTFEPFPSGSLVKGGIHGTNRSDNVDDEGGNPYNRMRFTNGASLDRWTGDAAGASSITCSSQKPVISGSHNTTCSQHRTQTYTQNYAD